MESVIDYLLSSPIGSYVLVVCLLCRVFVTVAPVSLTEKIPDWIMLIISACALSSNKVADNKGNKL